MKLIPTGAGPHRAYLLQAETEEEVQLLAAAPFDTPRVFLSKAGTMEIRFPAHDCLQEGRPEGQGRSPLVHLPVHPATRVWRDEPYSREGVQVYSCRVCGQGWGRRYQWDAGTGNDDRWWRIEAVSPDQ